MRLPHQWFVACASGSLKTRPLATTLHGTGLVLFRTRSGQPAALLDRCPHRNVPLSEGDVVDEQIRCRYHGWRFDAAGECRVIPCLIGSPEGKGRRTQAFAVREQDGFIWVYSTPDVVPAREPFRFPHLEDSRYSTVRRSFLTAGTVHAGVENALDVPHTAFLHGGLFRKEVRGNEIEVIVRRSADRVEAEYVGEPRPTGLAGRILAPGGGTVTHFDRFLLPSISQVEYQLGKSSHLVVTTAFTPLEDFKTQLFAVVSYRLPLPGWLVRPFVSPVAHHIFQQDASILKSQTDNIARFGGERFLSTEIDVLGLQIWQLMKNAARNEAPLPPHEHRLRMRT